jgi:hypothetical protein
MNIRRSDADKELWPPEMVLGNSNEGESTLITIDTCGCTALITPVSILNGH